MTPNERFMRRAIELSTQGFPAPNPHVGCVIVKNGEIVGEGFHDHAGGPHAEVVALQQAGGKTNGADVYVTLEPCNHTGRTPPCSLTMINAKVRSVIFACADPNPRAAGGSQTLQEAGIEVCGGVLAHDARTANERFMSAMERGRTFIEAKAAMSLDGRVALPSGESKWITNEMSREQGHWLRAQCGAVLVGRNTVETDDPLLTARIPGVVNQPTRLVLDPNGKLSGNEKVFNDDAQTFRIVRKSERSNDIEAEFKDNAIDWNALAKQLFEKGITSLLIEGGPATLSSALKSGVVNRLHLFVAPKVLGAGPAWFNSDASKLTDALHFVHESSHLLGDDMWLIYRPAAR